MSVRRFVHLVDARQETLDLQDCKARLAREHRRMMLEELDTQVAEADISDAQMRRMAGEMLARYGLRPTEEDVTEFAADLRKGERRFQRLINEITDEIEQFIPNIARQEAALYGGGPIFLDRCVGAFVYPTGKFNATARRTEAGDHLILMNAGVMELLWQTAKIISHTTRVDAVGFTYLDDVRLGLNQLTTAEALAEVVAVYLGEPSSGLGVVPRKVGPDGERAVSVYRACATFLVAHEYAHVLAGHTGHEDRAAALDDPTRHHEIAADSLGTKLLLARWRWGNFVDDASNTGLQTLLSGPLLFFALENVIAEAERREGRAHDIIGTEHPAVRRVMLQPLYAELAGGVDYKTAWPLAGLYEDWVFRIERDVMKSINHIRRPGSNRKPCSD